jgi:hypothetical protein
VVSGCDNWDLSFKDLDISLISSFRNSVGIKKTEISPIHAYLKL